MSLRAMLWALNDAPCTNPGDAFVLVALADNAWDDGKGAFPAIATIAKRARISERTVQRSLRTLEADGLIRHGDQTLAASYGRYAPTVYELAVAEPAGRFTTNTTPEKPQVNRGDRLSPLTTANTPRGDTRGHLGVTRVSPEPVLNPKSVRGEVGGGTHLRARAQKTPTENSPKNSGHDEYGPTSPRCPRHVHATNDPPCWDCGATRTDYAAARIKRVAAGDRARADRAREARRLEEATGPANPASVALARTAAKDAAAAVKVRSRQRVPG